MAFAYKDSAIAPPARLGLTDLQRAGAGDAGRARSSQSARMIMLLALVLGDEVARQAMAAGGKARKPLGGRHLSNIPVPANGATTKSAISGSSSATGSGSPAASHARSPVRRTCRPRAMRAG